jgi:tetratricopeptide (TPR) repeat protein
VPQSSPTFEITTEPKRCLLILPPWGGGEALRLRGKNFEFFCLLLANDSGRFISAAEVHRLPLWKNMEVRSVGKQVARLIGSLLDVDLDVIDYTKKTDGWRLKPSILGQIDPPTREAAKGHIAATSWNRCLQFADAPVASVASWTRYNVKALLEMTIGNAGLGYDELRLGYAEAATEELQSISNVLATRIGQRLTKPQLPLPSETNRFSTMFELAVEARRIAAYALRSESQEWRDYAQKLEQMLPSIAVSGDSTSQAILLNALAMLYLRMGQRHDAIEFIREAAPIAVFSGDLILIQNVVFNFGNILSEMRRADPHFCGQDEVFSLLELDIDIRHRFNLGKDSAQAELLVAFLYYEHQNWEKAEFFLGQAAQIIDVSKQYADRALYHRIRGLLRTTTNKPDTALFADGIKDFDAAIEIYRGLGNLPRVNVVATERARAQTNDMAKIA